jgi:hypothetical protein
VEEASPWFPPNQHGNTTLQVALVVGRGQASLDVALTELASTLTKLHRELWTSPYSEAELHLAAPVARTGGEPGALFGIRDLPRSSAKFPWSGLLDSSQLIDRVFIVLWFAQPALGYPLRRTTCRQPFQSADAELDFQERAYARVPQGV